MSHPCWECLVFNGIPSTNWITSYKEVMPRPSEHHKEATSNQKRDWATWSKSSPWEVLGELPPSHPRQRQFKYKCMDSQSQVWEKCFKQVQGKPHIYGMHTDFVEASTSQKLSHVGWGLNCAWSSPLISRETLSRCYIRLGFLTCETFCLLKADYGLKQHSRMWLVPAGWCITVT